MRGKTVNPPEAPTIQTTPHRRIVDRKDTAFRSNERTCKNRGNSEFPQDISISLKTVPNTSEMLAKCLISKPAVAQFAAQRFMATAPNMKVEGEKARAVHLQWIGDA